MREDDASYMGEALGNGLGSVKDDLIKVISLIPGVGNQAAAKFNEFEQLIRTEAETGAKNAIPQIRTEVRKEVTPYTIAALALGVGGLLVGFGALLIARGARRRAGMAGLRGPSTRRRRRR